MASTTKSGFIDLDIMAALRGDDIIAVPLTAAVAELKLVPRSLYDQAAAFFG